MYHVLVDLNTETQQTDINLTFEKFKALVINSKLPNCTIESRFYNALGQLEYIGAIVMGSEGVLRLVYLPTYFKPDNDYLLINKIDYNIKNKNDLKLNFL